MAPVFDRLPELLVHPGWTVHSLAATREYGQDIDLLADYRRSQLAARNAQLHW